jgi:hypothetical protein
MKWMTPITLLVLATASPLAVAQGYDFPRRLPNLSGAWYMNGDEDAPCEIIQRGRGDRALFINERGDQTWGQVRPDSVWIPAWTDGRHRGLYGRLRGNRIVWPDGNYWSHRPEFSSSWEQRDPYWPR